jgi:CRP-like cAMP-binding protein
LSLFPNINASTQHNIASSDIIQRHDDNGDIESKDHDRKSQHQIAGRDSVSDNYDTKSMSALVLKLLNEKPMDTREIQSKVGRSREHTSRFMKNLFLEGLVSRDINTKPFLYTLTDEGHKRLKVSHSDV